MIRVYQGKRRGLGESPTNEGYIQLGFEMRGYLKEFRQISPSALSVFLAIVLHSNEDGWSWPTQELLSAETGWSVETVSEATGRLCRASINGKRLLLAYQPVRDDGTFAQYRYLTFPDDQECAEYEGRALSLPNKVALASPPPTQPGAVEPQAEQPPAVEAGAKKNHLEEKPVSSEAEFLGRVLENPAKPLTDKQAALIGRGTLNARKRKAGEDEVETALNAMRVVSMRINALSVGWTRPAVKEAVRGALDRGEDATILAVKFEDWIHQAREKMPGAWQMISPEWLKAIIDKPVEGAAAKSAAVQRREAQADEPISEAFLAGPPPSPTKDPVGLARWKRGIADSMFNGNAQAASDYYEDYCNRLMDEQDATQKVLSGKG